MLLYHRINFIPSTIWFLIIVIPALGFLGVSSKFLSVFEYLLVVSIVGIFMFLADFVSARLLRRQKVTGSDGALEIPLLFVMAAFFISVLHSFLLPQWPLFDLVIGNINLAELSFSRERASKLSNLPSWFVYLGQSFFLVSVLFMIGLCPSNKRLGIGGLFFLLLLGFWDGSKFKGILVSMFLLTVLLSNAVKVEFHRLLGIGLPLILIIGLIYTFYLENSVQTNLAQQSVSTDSAGANFPYSFGDILRLERDEVGDSNSVIQQIRGAMDYLAYRVFVIPSDVGFRWFEYRRDILRGEFARFERGLANRIGKWGYWERFPQHFLPSISAYASFDMDAMIRFGYSGLIIAVSGVFAFRVLLALLFARFPIANMYAATLCIWGLMLPSASIQALLVAQGFGVLLVCLIFVTLVMRADDQ